MEQQQKVRKIPMRQCRGCGEHRPKSEMIRVLRTPEGEIVLDLTGKRNGRGAYLCRKTACLKKARKGNRIGRELGVEISEEVYDALEKEMEADAGA